MPLDVNDLLGVGGFEANSVGVYTGCTRTILHVKNWFEESDEEHIVLIRYTTCGIDSLFSPSFRSVEARVISVRYSNVALRSGSEISVPPGVMIPTIRQKCNMSVSGLCNMTEGGRERKYSSIRLQISLGRSKTTAYSARSSQ